MGLTSMQWISEEKFLWGETPVVLVKKLLNLAHDFAPFFDHHRLIIIKMMMYLKESTE